MAGVELEAGKRWTEQRFTETAAELGAVGGVAPGDRWRELGKRFRTDGHCMTYYVELAGHVKRGEMVFRDVDLEDAGAGEKTAQIAIERQIRNLLESLRPAKKNR